MSVALIGHFRVPVDKLNEARPLMRKLVEATRQEPGCIQYNFAEDLLDPGLIRISEIWETRENLATHVASSHVQLWGGQRDGVGVHARDIDILTISASGKL